MELGTPPWRLLRLLTFALLPTLFVGCSRSSAPLSPMLADPSPEASTGIGAVVQGEGVVEAALGVYRWEIDAVGMTVTSSMAERQAQKTDSLYLLSVDRFFGPGDVTIESVARYGDQLKITYDIHHPFPAPSKPSGPASATNRVDLGIAGRILFLAEVPSATGHSYFADAGDPVIANTSLVANPDAYFRPNGLLTQLTIANTFPYQTLVDESGPGGSRLGVSNGGDPLGNYGVDGWTRTELGATNDRWTGYGVLHQGQTSRRRLALNLSGLPGNSISLDMAILAKYNDPRGGASIDEKRANRLPPEVPDAMQFAYRMPHGALDVERIRLVGTPTRLLADLAGNLALSVALTDWDARAIETTESDLANDLEVTHVEVRESGAPSLALCLPGVISDASAVIHFPAEDWLAHDDRAIGGDPGVDSGAVGDELYYPLIAAKPLTTGQLPGEYTGMIRATDVEADIDTRGWRFHYDEQQHPITGNLPRLETYQAFTVTLEAPPPRQPGWQYAPNGGGDEYITRIAVDSQSNTIVAGYVEQNGTDLADYGGGARPNGGDSDMFIVKLDSHGAYLWDKHIAASGYQYSAGIATDSAGNIFWCGPFTGTVNFGGGDRIAQSWYTTFLVKLGSDGSYKWDCILGSSGSVTAQDISLQRDGLISLLVWVSGGVDFGGGYYFAQERDSVVVVLDSAGDFVRNSFLSGAGDDDFYVMAVDSADNHYVAGHIDESADFGTGPIDITSGQEMLLVKLNALGAVERVQQFGGDSYDVPRDIAIDPSSQAVLLAGYSASSSIDFGGGPRTQVDKSEIFIVKFDADGAYMWDHFYGYPGYQIGASVEVNETGEIFLGGGLEALTDFGCGNMESAGRDDSFVVRYDSAGTAQWSRIWGGYKDEQALNLALAPDGGLRTAGVFFSESMDFDPGPGVKLDSAVNRDAFVTNLNRSDGLW